MTRRFRVRLSSIYTPPKKNMTLEKSLCSIGNRSFKMVDFYCHVLFKMKFGPLLQLFMDFGLKIEK